MKKLILILLIASALPVLTYARLGVGIGSGKIQVDQALKAGLIYDLPSITILNTGDEPSDYGVGIQYQQDQPEMKAPKDWFSFEPSRFHLEPGKVQVVKVKLTLPVKGAKPGNYFVYLQGFPLQKENISGTTIGIAAASKLYFTVAPSNFIVGIYYRAVSLMTEYSPWSYILIGVIILIALILYLRRHISIGVSFKAK